MSAVRSRWPCLAVAQLPMAWTVEGNLASIRLALEQAAQAGAALCVLPELALSGFHRDIAFQSRKERIEPALAEVQALCKTLRLAAVLGLPWTESPTRLFNSMVFIDADGGLLGRVDKHGLTDSEAAFFTPGAAERPVFELAGLRCTAVLCREVDDFAALAPGLTDQRADLLLWPSYIAWPPLAPRDAPDYGPAAAALARQCKAVVLQCNWPQALNEPETCGMGGSRWIDSFGQEVLSLPQDQAGLAILGSECYDWRPLIELTTHDAD